MIDGVQELTDGLAEALGRSVAVDDGSLRLLACSTHFGEVDPQRISSLVHRRVTGDGLEAVRRHRVLQWTDPDYLPPQPDLGMRRRYVVPLRTPYELLGLLWVIVDDDLGAADVARIDAVATEMIDALEERRTALDARARRTDELLAELGSPSTERREAAAAELVASGRLAARPSYRVVRVVDREADDTTFRAIRHAAATLPLDAWLIRPRPDGAEVLVGAAAAPGAATATVDRLAADILAAADRLGRPGLRIGLGDDVALLADVRHSAEQAGLAARVPSAEPIARFGASPGASLLESVLPDEVPAHLVPAVLRDLEGVAGAEGLEAVRTYLACGGSASTAAGLLGLHRSTIYYRLNRFTADTGLDLERDDDRLALALWFALQARGADRRSS